jgi:hypothetical protein
MQLTTLLTALKRTVIKSLNGCSVKVWRLMPFLLALMRTDTVGTGRTDPEPLLHVMVEKRFQMRSVDQQIQDVLEPGRFAQTFQHNKAPGPHIVNIPERPLKAFATFVTVADSHAYSAGGQSLVVKRGGFSTPQAVERESAMGFMRGTTLLDPPNSEADRRRLLGGTIDLFAMTILVGAAKTFQTIILTA